MTALRSLVAICCLFSSPAVFACSCSNSTPIQRTSDHYADRAVFTAHVVQLMGRIYNWDGKRLSSQVLAVVKERYWGLPWYWPKIVILDGSYPCDIAMEEGQDYLVSGHRWRYGVLGVNGCSRTQPLSMAQVDLRTLDGSHCAGPGGTVMGRIHRGRDSYRVNPIAPDLEMTFRDQDGNIYTAQSDDDGIYEVQHLAAGIYTLDSRISERQYLAGGFTVLDKVCGEADALVREYEISGRLFPGLGYHASVKLQSVQSAEKWMPGDLRPDGRFYFNEVPDGEYFLVVSSVLQGAGNDLYYPGTSDRSQATRIRILNHAAVGAKEFDFKPERIPFVAIPVTIDFANESAKFSWRILLVTPNNIVEDERWIPGAKYATLYGLRGQSYAIRLLGDPDYTASRETCTSADVPVKATPERKIVHVAAPEACR